MESNFSGPVNIGSDEMVTINQLAEIVMEVSGKKVDLNHIEGPLGVRGRCSDNALIEARLGWRPTRKLIDGIRSTYEWISEQVEKSNNIVCEENTVTELS